MTTKNILNSFSLLSYKNLNRAAMRGMLVMLCLLTLGVGQAWASTYYSKVTTAANPTAAGKVYVIKGDNTVGTATSATNSGDSKTQTYSVKSVASPGYYFSSWSSTGSTKLSFTSGSANPTTCTISASSEDKDNPTSGTATGNFTAITVSSVSPATLNLGTLTSNSSTADGLSGSLTFTSSHAGEQTTAAADFNAPTIKTTPSVGTATVGVWTASGTTITVPVTYKGNGSSWGGTNRTITFTVCLESKGDTGNGKTATVTASYPNAKITSGSTEEIYATFKTADATQAGVERTAVFDVELVDGTDNFDTPSITGSGESHFTYNSMSYADGKLTVTYTYNGNKEAGDHTATLTLKLNNAIGGTDATYGSKSVTLIAHNEQESDYDAKIENASGGLVLQGDWASVLAKQANGYKITLLRNVDLGKLAAAQNITTNLTLDLNGKTLSGTVSSSVKMLLYMNKSSRTLTIMDSKTGGKLSATGAYTNALYGVFVNNGNVVLNSGTIEITNTNTSQTTADRLYATGVYVNAGKTFTMNGGTIVSHRAARDAYGVYVHGTATARGVATINAGTINVTSNTYAYGIRGYGDIEINGGTINAETLTGGNAFGVYVRAAAAADDAASYAGTLNMTDGIVTAKTKTSSAYGILIQGVTALSESATDGTHSNKATAKCNITGGTIKALPTTTTAYGVLVQGDTNSKNGEHLVAQIKNATIIAEGEHPSGGNEKANIYGVYVHAVNDSARLGLRQGDVELTNCNVTATARKGQTAVAVYVHAVQFCKLADPYQGEEVATAGKVTINSGTYTAETTAGRYAYAVQSATRVKSILGIEAYPEIIIHGGTFTTTTGTTNSYAVNAGGTTTIDGGTFNATSGTTTAVGIYHLAGKLTVSGVKITSHATTNTAYGVFLTGGIHDYTGYAYASDAELNNIDATVTTGSGSTAYGVWLNAVMKSETQARYDAYMAGTAHAVTKSHYDQVWSLGGHAIVPKVTINGGTYKVTSATSTAYGAWSKKTAHPAELDVEASPEMTIKNATFNVTATTETAGGVRCGGPLTIDNCNITVNAKTKNAYGVLMDDKTGVVSNSTIDVTTPTGAYGLYANSPICTKVEDCWGALGIEFVGKIEANDNIVTAKATGGNTSYAVYVSAANAATASGPLAGDHAIAGEATINGGKYTATASGTTAYAACVADPVLQGEATATPTLIINGGKFKGTAGAAPFADVSLAGEPGYFVLNGGYYVKDENLDKKLGEGMNKVAVKSGTPEYTEGYRYRVTDNMTGEYVCKIQENSTSYASLEEALQVVNATPNSTWTIIMIANYTLSKGDYVLPANTTLLIPYLTSQTAAIGTGGRKLNPTENVEPYEAPYPLYKLTFANGVNMTVHGTIEASAVTYMSNQNLTSRGTGIVSGAYGWLYLAEGSYIDLESTAKLIAWGYVTGKGEINAKSGSKVYEDFQIGDWRGGSAESGAMDNKNGLDSKSVFVITHYYYQNIECPITYRPGATAYGWGGTYMYRDGYTSFDSFDQAVPLTTPVAMVGTSDAMFCMSAATSGDDTWVRKEYNPETDYVNWTMNSGASLGSIRIQMSLPMIGNMDVTSSDYVLPITSNFNVIANYGEINLTNHVCFIPGSKLTIKKEGILTIPTGQKAFFYDQDNWSSYSGYWFYPGYSPSWKVNPRVATFGDKTKVKMPDAEVLVEGTLNVQGAIYTTSGGANIHSTRENAGKVKFSAALPASTEAIAEWYGSSKPNLTLCQWTAFKKPAGEDESKVHFTGKALNPAWLKNEDGSYSKPTSANTDAGDIWTYMQSLTEDTYEWTLASEDGCFTTRRTGDTKTYVHPSDWVAVGSVNANHAYPSEDGTRMFVNTEAASTSVSCKWWDVNPTPEVIDGTTYYVANNENFDNFGTYYYWDNTTSYWKPKKITVTWQNEDGTKITNGTYGDLYSFNTSPQFFGTNPKKTPTAIEKYDWIGWRDAEGNIYDKNATLPRATSNVTYTAYFNTTKYQYTITFKNNDNSDLWAGLVDAGTTGAELQALFETKYNEKTGNTVPQKAPTVDKVFTFTGWNTALATVTAAATYTAQYGESVRKYTVTFLNYNAVDELYTVDVDYNTRPTYSGVTPFRANTSAFSYDWTGWQQGTNTYGTTAALPVVTGNISYIATFAQTELQYQVFFKRQDGTIIDAPKFSYEETPSAFPTDPTMASTVSTDYTFREWSPATLVPVTEDGKVYTALFDESPRQYTAHFVNYDGASLNADQTIDYNTIPTYTGADPMKPNDSRNSYVFSGWAWAAGDGWEAGSIGAGEAFPAIKGEMTFTAQYNPALLQFDVIYQREDGTVILRDKKKWGESSAFPTSGLNYEDEAYTYTFDHWDPATVTTPVTADATYTAYYNRSIKTYSFSSIATTPVGYGTVSPASLAGIPSGSTVTVKGNTITVNGTTITATPAAADAQYTYTFDHWNNVPATVTGNISDIEAVFTRTVNQYDVTFDMKEHGSAISKQTKDYGSKVDKPADPSEAGYTFVGWYKEDACTNVWNFASDEVTGATTLYAKWTVNSYTITFDGNGGSAVASITQNYGTAVTPPANPTRTGYTFAGWDPDVPATMPVDGANCVAQWTINSYQINFVDEDGTTNLGSYPQNLDYGTAVTAPEEPTKAADATNVYTFAGWSDGVSTYASADIPAVSGAVTYTATYNSAPTVASVTVSGATTYYATLQAAFDYAQSEASPNITVLRDINLSTDNAVYTNSKKSSVVVFELNGHKVSGACTNMLHITGTQTFTFKIQDSSVGHTGQIYDKLSSNKARCCVYAHYGTVELLSGTIYMENYNTGTGVQAYGVQVRNGANYKFNMKAGKIEVHSTRQAIGIYTGGTTTVSGGKIIVKETRRGYAAGVHVVYGTTTISDDADIDVSGTTNVRGVIAGGLQPAVNSKKTAVSQYNGTVKITGGRFTVTASANTAYGVYAYKNTFALDYATNQTCPGNYVSAGTANISGGEFTVTSTGATAYGVCVQASESIKTAKDADGNATYAEKTATPKANITGGKFNVSGTSSVGAVNTDATNTALVVEGGWYNDATNLDDYTAPAKDCNYHVLPLTGEDPYKYEVAEVLETGFYADIVDVDNTSKTLTLNVAGWPAGGWPYTINETAYGKSSTSGQAKWREDDRTLILPYGDKAPGESFPIVATHKNGTIVSRHNYIIPTEVKTDVAISSLTAKQMIYVKDDATLTIDEDTEVKNIYVAPGAHLKINSGVTLTADTVLLRTTPWLSAEMDNEGALEAQLCYTRIIKDQSQYFQFGLPYDCPLSSVKLSDGTTTATYGSAWLLRSYSESLRAKNGMGGDNWVSLAAGGTIQGCVGYEMFSAFGYYREFYFPVTPTDNTIVPVTRTTEDTKGAEHEGWNIIISPLTNTYTVDPVPEGWAISWLQPDGSYNQEPATVIAPALPFSYQAKASGNITFGAETTVPSAVAARRVMASEEPTRIQWIHLDLKDANGVGDQTSIYAHPTRYEDTYKTGIDVSKQSLTASRATIYSSHVYGEMAFAGVSDSLLARGVALTVYSPRAQELTFSMRENNWLNRLAAVWLIDNETGYRTDLLWSTYTFDAPEGTTAGRFTIAGEFYAPQIATGMEGTSARDNKARKVLIDQKMYILVNGQVFDATGKMVTE